MPCLQARKHGMGQTALKASASGSTSKVPAARAGGSKFRALEPTLSSTQQPTSITPVLHGETRWGGKKRGEFPETQRPASLDYVASEKICPKRGGRWKLTPKESMTSHTTTHTHAHTSGERKEREGRGGKNERPVTRFSITLRVQFG